MVGDHPPGDDLRVAVTRKTHQRKVASGELAFHRCAPDPECPHCAASPSETTGDAFDWSFLDAAYCISLQTREDRAAQAAAEFHRVGLCRLVVFCRPVREDRTAKKNIWRSHRIVAQHAHSAGARRVLVLEDDVVFSRALTPATVKQVGVAISRLPTDWMLFYLGHWPIWAHFVDEHILATSSLCTHAYIANEPLLRWIRRHRCQLKREGRSYLRARLTGSGIDAAFAEMPGTYAFHPMIAFQRISPNDHVMRGYQPGELSQYAVLKRVREYLVTHQMRTAEIIAVAVSPLTRRIVKRKASGGAD